MSTIKTLLEKQAQAVKVNSEKLKQAEALERQAAALRAEANKPVKIDLAAIRKAKDERINRFAEAIAKNKFSEMAKKAEDLLTRSGWQRDGAITQPDSKNIWVNPSKPNVRIEIKGSNYIVYKNNEPTPETPLSELGNYLTK